jgi:hypothetical protein
MWLVKYYQNGGRLMSKYFSNLHEATAFAVYEAPFESVHSMDLIK